MKKKKNQHPSPREYRVKYFVNGSETEEVSYYSVFHSSEALDFLAHTFRKGHIQGQKLRVVAVEEYDRFRDAWDDMMSYATDHAESPEISISEDQICIISNIK